MGVREKLGGEAVNKCLPDLDADCPTTQKDSVLNLQTMGDITLLSNIFLAFQFISLTL